MKMKRLACRGMMILLAVVLLCLFFSGTFKTITTPRVQIVTVKSGRLTETFEFPCELVYLETELIRCDVPEMVVVAQCYVQPGDQVEAGAPLFSLQLMNEADQEAQLTETYEQLLLEQLEIERKYTMLNPEKTELAYIAAYENWENAVLIEGRMRMEVEQALGECESWAEEGYPEGASESQMEVLDHWRETVVARELAAAEFQKAAGNGIRDTVWFNYTQRRAVEKNIADAKETIESFYTDRERIKNITAPHAGYIADVFVKAGDSYNGASYLYELTGETGGPAIEVDTTLLTKNLTESTTVKLSTEWGKFETEILSSGVNQSRQRCIYLSVPEKLEKKGIPLRRINGSQMSAVLSLKMEEAHALVPVSAIHGTGQNRYVYVVEETTTVLGNTSLKVSKVSVTVLAEAEGMAAIRESLERSRLAYMEDKELSDGITVMGGTE